MNDSTMVWLLCILIDDELKVCDSPFAITVPTSEEIGRVIHFVKEVTPSLQDDDHGKFTSYKPPSHYQVSVLHSFHGFQLTQENLESALQVSCKINEVFREKDVGHGLNIDVIVHINGKYGMFFYLLIDDMYDTLPLAQVESSCMLYPWWNQVIACFITLDFVCKTAMRSNSPLRLGFLTIISVNRQWTKHCQSLLRNLSEICTFFSLPLGMM
jgi:hypothetical protein